MTCAQTRPRIDTPRHLPRSRRFALLLSIVVVAAGTGSLACGRPLPRGAGTTTLVVHATEIETPTGRMVGRARIEVVDYEDECPRLFDRTIFGMRKAVEVLGKDDGPVEIGLTQGHVFKVSLQHRGAGDARTRACESTFWFTAEAGSRYDIALRSDLHSCSVSQPQPRRDLLTPYPTCEEALKNAAAASPSSAPAGTAADGMAQDGDR